MKEEKMNFIKHILMFWCVIFQVTGYCQSVQIQPNNQNCITPGQGVTLNGTVTGLGQNGNLQCLKWTSDPPSNIANDWMPSVTVFPAVATDYILSIMEGQNVVASDTLKLMMDVMADFSLPCGIDTIANKVITVASIAQHTNQACLTGVQYSPSIIQIPHNVGKKTFTITATHQGVTLTETITLVNSSYKEIEVEMSLANGYFRLLGTGANGHQFRHTIDYRALATVPKLINQIMDPLPFPVDVKIKNSVGLTGSGHTNYGLCLGQTPCYDKEARMSAGFFAQNNLEATANLDVGIAGLYAGLTTMLRIELNAELVSSCGGNRLCPTFQVTGEVGGIVGAKLGGGILKIDGGIVGGLTGSGHFCVDLPGFNNLTWGFTAGYTDIYLRARVFTASFVVKEVRYVWIRGQPARFSFP